MIVEYASLIVVSVEVYQIMDGEKWKKKYKDLIHAIISGYYSGMPHDFVRDEHLLGWMKYRY